MITGRRRPCLVLIQRADATDGQFGPAVQWVEFTKAWVSIDPDRGKEQYTAHEREALVTHVMRGDWIALRGVTEEMRVVYNDEMLYQDPLGANSRVFDILAVIPDDNGHGDTMLKVEEKGRGYGAISS